MRDSTGVITSKLLAEKANPQADIVFGVSASSLAVFDNEGMLLPYAPKGLDKVSAKYRDSKNPPAWVGMDVYGAAICFNTVEAQKLGLPKPETWKDLTKPVYKGQVVMPHPASSGTGYLDVSGWIRHHDPPLVHGLGQVLPRLGLGQSELLRLDGIEADRCAVDVRPTHAGGFFRVAVFRRKLSRPFAVGGGVPSLSNTARLNANAMSAADLAFGEGASDVITPHARTHFQRHVWDWSSANPSSVPLLRRIDQELRFFCATAGAAPRRDRSIRP